jgi:hypothetical protein
VIAVQTTTLLSQLGAKPATFGWDVVCAIQADLLGDLLARNYVIQSEERDTQNPIAGSVALSDGVSVQFDNVTLAEPLISISPDLQPQEFNLRMSIIGGCVSVVRAVNGVSYVSSMQVISAADGYALQGIVSLKILQGTVQNGQDVVVTITDPSSFAANLSFGDQGANTTLGQYLASLVTGQSQLNFALGTIIAGPNANLIPVSFQFSTQIDSTNPNDSGRLLLFIATAYNPNGGTQTSLAMDNVVPDGFSCTTIIAPGAFLKQIIAPALASRCQSGALSVDVRTSPFQVYFEHGLFSLGTLEFIDHAGRHVFSWAGEADPPFSSGSPNTADPIIIPLDRGWMRPAMLDAQASLMFQWVPSWQQGFYILEKNKGATCQLGFSWSQPAPDGAPFMTASVNSQTNTVSFGQVAAPNVVISKISNSDLIGSKETDNVIANIAAFVQQNLPAAIPAIDAQSVTSLVLPGQSILSFEQVYFGYQSQDMILFGSVNAYGVTVSPVTVNLKPSQVQAFIADLPPGDTEGVTWSCRTGQISTGGLYTAPARIPAAAMDIIVATRNSDKTMQAAAFVSLVPQDVSLSPDCAVVYPGCPSLRVIAPAAPAGASVQYALNPATGCGSIDTNGNYSAPESCSAVQKVTVTAIYNQQAIGESFLVLLPAEPSALSISPISCVVQSGENQTFTTAGEVGKWSAFSPLASTEMSQNGGLTAPYVSEPTCVVVVATTSAGDGYGVAVAVVQVAD